MKKELMPLTFNFTYFYRKNPSKRTQYFWSMADNFTKSNGRSTGPVEQWSRALASQAEGWEFESQPRQTQVVTAPLPNAQQKM